MANTVETMLPEEILRKIIDGSFEGTFEDESVTKLPRDRCFSNIPGLTRIKFPNVTTVGGKYGLEGTAITQIGYEDLENCTEFRGWLYGDKRITVAVLPSVTSNPSYSFQLAKITDAVDFTEVKSIANQSWASTTQPPIMILRGDTVVTLGTNNCLPGGITTIYVPQALIESYKSATNWSLHHEMFAPIEGSQYEHYYADGTPIAIEGGY